MIAYEQWPITVLMNVASGHGDGNDAKRLIAEAFADTGRVVDIIQVPGGHAIAEVARRTVQHAQSEPRIVVAAGGDGTLNAIASELVGIDVPLGVIPLGTFNYFARDLGIPQDVGEAARAIATGVVRRVHVARINGHVFLNNASFGLYQRLLEEREFFKQRFGRYRFIAAVAGLVTLLRHHRTYHVELLLDGRAVTLQTPMVFFASNTLQLEQLELPVARCTDAGLVALLVLRPASKLRLLGLALRGAIVGLRDAAHLDCHCAASVTVRTRRWRRRLRVAIDGEMIECELPLNISVAKSALQVIVPRVPAPRE